MSWERFDHKMSTVCACGKGKVIIHFYTESDDWNRSREGIISEEICCDNCKTKFHIEHYVKTNFNSKEGYVTYKKIYLVPNGKTIHLNISPKDFHFRVDEEIVSRYSLDEIIQAKTDMQQNKFSTRLQLDISKNIVSLYYNYHRKKRLGNIINMLQSIEDNYNQYKWTPSTLKQFRNQEKIEIEKNSKQIESVLNQSYEVKFKGGIL